MIETFLQIYILDLQKVIKEIESYQNEDNLWTINEHISNSGGNLALHLIGNIKHFFGANLGETGYKRKRDNEFADKNVSRKQIIIELENCMEIIKQVFNDLTDEDLKKDYPEEFGGEVRQTGTIITYMLSHLNYHLGQINYHRRLLSEKID